MYTKVEFQFEIVYSGIVHSDVSTKSNSTNYLCLFVICLFVEMAWYVATIQRVQRVHCCLGDDVSPMKWSQKSGLAIFA
jgi:hypothetical protein